MTDATLRELADLNFAEALRELARRAGGAAFDEHGVCCWAGSHALPVLQNGAIRTAMRLDGAAVLAHAAAFFAPRRRGYTIVVRAHADADLERAAEAAGLLRVGEMPAMILRRRLSEPGPPPGVTLGPVRTPDDVAGYATVMAAAYATYGMAPEVATSALGERAVLEAPHIVTLLARLEGRPVAGAMTIVTHGVAGIYWVGTVPDARGRGLAALVTRVAGNAGFDLGARMASLQASPMGEPVYRRMGYETIGSYPYWVRMQPPG